MHELEAYAHGIYRGPWTEYCVDRVPKGNNNIIVISNLTSGFD